jgi:hypothetical protein
MDLYKKLNLMPVRSEPDVWVSRLIIFDQITPDPIIIRDIPLSRGLNIILAEEVEDDRQPTEITGHSAGKTTFCRLLRYVLGERTFGTKRAMDLIRRAFPDGYVAAELHIHGLRWAVHRPFGSGRMSYIRGNASIEELLEQHGRSVTQELYSQELGMEGLLDELETGEVVQTGESIQWAHILAWCTRDQEARFQNIHEWRSPRSEAETPSFRFPKAGPLFVMRAVLGLFLPDELKDEARLAELQHDKDKLTREIEEKRREPRFRVNLYNHQLSQHLKSLLPNESDIDSRPFRSAELFPDDLERLTEKASVLIENNIKINDQGCDALQMQIDDLGADIRTYENELARLEVLFSLDNAANHELDADLKKREERRKIIEEMKDKPCPLGNVLIRECSYVQTRQSVLKIMEFQNSHAMKQAEAMRSEECNSIEEEKRHLRETVERMSGLRQTKLRERDALLTNVRKQREALHDLGHTWDELTLWMQKHNKSAGYEELDLLRRRLDIAESEITKIEKALNLVLQQHDYNRELLQSIFSGIVRSVLSSESYDGEVGLENRELSFRITHGQSMTGEAVETLSVLLADVCCIVYNSISDSVHLPGFLVHDSPREADLGFKIYQSFLRFAASLQEHFSSPDTCPFQYVVTTTTPPPPELNTDQFVKLRLNAAQPQELLLKANIATLHQQDISLWE